METVTQAEYERAIELWPSEIPGLVRNAHIVPNWFGDEDRFWFRLQDESGHRFRMVDARTGAIEPAFDHDIVAGALAKAGVDASAGALPLTHFDFIDAGRAILATTTAGAFRIGLADGAVERAPMPTPLELKGPGGQVLFLKDHDIWIRAADGTTRPLTTDGEPFNSWGHGSDLNMRKVASNRGEAQPMPTNIFWSPDGKCVLCSRVDERGLRPYPYMELVPRDGSPRPELHFVRLAMVGEAPAVHSYCFIDVATGEQTALATLPDDLGLRPDLGDVWWSEDGRFLYTLAMNMDATRAALVEFRIADGAVRVVHAEEAATFFDFNTYLYNRANVRLRVGGREFIWYSQKDGWGHLYAIDIETGSVRRLTQGDWAVADIVGLTEDRVFFAACGREPGRHPYHRYLYRIDLDGDAPNAGLTLLTPEDADHGFSGEPTPIVGRVLNRPSGLSPMSPSARYFVDSVSRVDLPARFILRDADGKPIVELARCDTTVLEATGWTPPEMFSAKAADGVTDLHGVLIKPRGFDPANRYPLVEHIYGGPQTIAQPRTFLDGLNGAFLFGMNTLADLGFVVAVLDGPGTPYRSKAFHDLTYGTADRWGIAHHRAALEGAAAARPWIDLDRVGVRGHSFGGYGTAAALLIEPDFYKVGVSSAGMYDVSWAFSGLENYFGRPDYGDGRCRKNGIDEVAANHWEMSPSRMADRLEGRLLLAVGDLDENIQPAGLFRFTDALIQAGKSYDLLVLPGRNHGFSAEAYFHKRTWDYFIEHLQGRRPLRHFMPAMKPGVRMFI